MIDFKKILNEDRKEFGWIASCPSFRMPALSEYTLSNYLTDYSNKFAELASNIGWYNDPRYIAPDMIDTVCREDLKEDTRVFSSLPSFSFVYREARTISRASRLGKLIEEIDVRTDRLNRRLPLIRDHFVNRDFIAEHVAKWTSIPLLGYVENRQEQEDGALALVELVYLYSPGKTAVTHPSTMSELKKHLERLK
ncbi:MAG: hypothetical protein AABX85_01415 [Nanoarchaeota archaeon]